MSSLNQLTKFVYNGSEGIVMTVNYINNRIDLGWKDIYVELITIIVGLCVWRPKGPMYYVYTYVI